MVKCPECKTENRQDAKFCHNCGANLAFNKLNNNNNNDNRIQQNLTLIRIIQVLILHFMIIVQIPHQISPIPL